MAAAAPHVDDFPPNVLQHILLTATTHHNLLRFAAACARVCGEWWRAVGGSAAYGRGLGAGEERARVLGAIAQALETGDMVLDLDNETRPAKRIGDAGAAALGAALMALPSIRYVELQLRWNKLTAAGAASVVPALPRSWGHGEGLLGLNVQNNDGLGDAGVATLAKALPPTLQRLRIGGTGCGDDGLAALAAALPALVRLRELSCNDNPAATARGWVALAGALPSLPALLDLYLLECPGVWGLEGAAALAAALPDCPRLEMVWLGSERGAGQLDEQAQATLHEAAARVPRSAERPLGLRIPGVTG